MNSTSKARATRDEVDTFLQGFLAQALPSAPTATDMQIPFLELGANSLVLIEVQRTVETRFGLTIALPQFFQELTHAEALSEYIVHNQATNILGTSSASQLTSVSAAIVPVQPLPKLQPLNGISEIESLFARQLSGAAEVIQEVISQQLTALKNGIAIPPASNALPNSATSTPPSVPAVTSMVSEADNPRKPSSAAVMHKLLSPLEVRARGLTSQQSGHLEKLIESFTARTKRSKELAARFRPALADSRAAVGFRFTTKEMLYPITGASANGSKLCDVDGNEYIDITMGQGVALFGHHPDFIDNALSDPANDMLLLGPRAPHAGEAAELICELTGMERVTFANSGTEAVMAALRLARAATKRTKVVIFENSYHGHADNVMARSVSHDGILSAAPVAPGITQGSVEDVVLLEYGSDDALEYLRNHAHEFAAIMVEPVQSRRPDLQPREFLHELRRITSEAGGVLIFDEMITGFRLHQGGAQAYYGVRADLVTYGKVVAGGMPIGVIAGTARLMDGIDGGQWQYGDDSYPEVDRTIFGGTFCQHPATMITMVATLRHLKEAGPGLQEGLNRLTARLASDLNDFFENEQVPIKVVHCGSLFRFAFNANVELLFYHMMQNGIFIWEWRNYFLSTAHTEDDVDNIIGAVKTSIFALRSGGFMPEKELVASASPQVLPLSQAQRQLSILAQINSQGSLAYHVSPLLKLSGELVVSCLRRAVRLLMHRHEALRTVIKDDVQEVFSREELSGAGLTITDTKSTEELELLLEEEANREFDLVLGPLFQVRLFKLGVNDHRILLKAHHIVVDGLSMNQLVQELAAIYTALIQGGSDGLKPALQLSDYVSWQNSEKFLEQKAFWLDQLSGDLPILELPTDYSLPPVRSYRGGRHRVEMSTSLFKSLCSLSRSEGCTSFMMLFAAYALWLHRLCQQEDVLVAVPVAGRALPGGDNLIAYATHLLPIRSRLEKDQPFTTYLRKIRDTLLAALENQDYPFADLIENPAFSERRLNLVQTIFNLDRPGHEPEMAGLEVEWVSQPLCHVGFDLVMNFTELGDRLVLECDYSLDCFAPESIVSHMNSFIALLEGIVAMPKESVYRLPMLDINAQREWLVDWNATAVEYPRQSTAIKLFEEQAARTPNALALQWEAGQMSYAQLEIAANKLGHLLIRKGVKPETVVAVCIGSAPELAIALLGVWKSGGAYLPLDPAYPAQRLNFMINDAGVNLVLTHSELVDRIDVTDNVEVLRMDGKEKVYAKSPKSAPKQTTTAKNLAYLIYTSGSTGKPKGTLITHRNLVNYLSWALKRYEFEEGNGTPLHASISFDGTITSIFCPLLAGRTLTLLPESKEAASETSSIGSALASAKADGRPWSLIKVTPAHLELLNDIVAEGEMADATRFIVLGGEALLWRQVALWRNLAPATRIINEYGPTETVVGCCIHEVTDTDAEADAIPIGRPIANTQLYVLDRNLQPLPPGAKGELFIGGDGVARGYHNRPELTSELFFDISETGLNGLAGIQPTRLYRTRDLVRHLPDGNLVYLGRLDQQVQLRGFRVELGEIENALGSLTDVREAIVVVHDYSTHDRRLIAYVSALPGATLEENNIRSLLGADLPVHMLPSRIIVLDRLPLSDNGKLDRNSLPKPDGNRAMIILDALSSVEKKIAAVWCSLLDVPQVGRHDNFFEIGGHSLLVLPLRNSLQDLLGFSVSAVDVFRYPSVAAQARFFNSNSEGTPLVKEHLDQAQDSAQRRRNAQRKMRERRHG